MSNTPVPPVPAATPCSKPHWLWILTAVSLGLNALVLIGFIFCPRLHRSHPPGGQMGMPMMMPGQPTAGPMQFHGHASRPEAMPQHQMGGGFPGGPMGMNGGGREGEHRGERGMDRGPGGERGMERLTDRLNLTDAQKKQIQPLIEQQATAIQKKAEENRKAIQQILDDTKAKIKPLLNADQQKQLEQLPEGPRGAQPVDAPKK